MCSTMSGASRMCDTRKARTRFFARFKDFVSCEAFKREHLLNAYEKKPLNVLSVVFHFHWQLLRVFLSPCEKKKGLFEPVHGRIIGAFELRIFENL